MKATTTMKATITITLVITLSLLLIAGTLVISNNNVLAKEDSGGDKGSSDDGKGKDGGDSNKDNGNQGSKDKPSDGDTNTADGPKPPDNSKPETPPTIDSITKTTTPDTGVNQVTETPNPTNAGKPQCDITTPCPDPQKMIFCGEGFVPVGGKCEKAPPSLLDPNDPTKCREGTHLILTLGCVKDHLSHDEAFDLGCKLGTNDGEDQENFVGTGPHSSGFIRGYNQGFAGHSCNRHSHGDGGGGNGINTAISGTTTPITTTTTTPVFKESTDIPVSTNVAIGPTTKTVDTAGWLHIVGDIKNSGKSSVTIEPQISGRVMNANNQTIGIEYATPLSTTIQPGQTTAFEMLVGGTGIPNLSDISSIQYHVGIVGSSK